MNGVNVLKPQSPSADPMEKVFARLASLEGRVQAMERHRDIKVTPFSVLLSSGGSVDVDYMWDGGRVWIMHGGIGSQSTGGAAGVRIEVRWNGNNTNADLIGYAETSASVIALGTKTREIPTAWLAASNTINFLGIGTSASTSLTGLIIEWPSV